jgi:hypothetical protein
MPFNPGWISAVIAVFALGATAYSAYTSHASLELTRETQQLALFSQFQNEYAAIALHFPAQLLDRNFRPARDSDDYKRLEDYWIFCYAEWYATQRTDPLLYGRLWNEYYANLILNALEIPSLRYVLTDMMTSYGVKRSDMQRFYAELNKLAEDAGEPLAEAAPAKVDHLKP